MTASPPPKRPRKCSPSPSPVDILGQNELSPGEMWQTDPKPTDPPPYSPKDCWHYSPSPPPHLQLFDEWYPHDQQPRSPSPLLPSEWPPSVKNPCKRSRD